MHCLSPGQNFFLASDLAGSTITPAAGKAALSASAPTPVFACLTSAALHGWEITLVFKNSYVSQKLGFKVDFACQIQCADLAKRPRSLEAFQFAPSQRLCLGCVPGQRDELLQHVAENCLHLVALKLFDQLNLSQNKAINGSQS